MKRLKSPLLLLKDTRGFGLVEVMVAFSLTTIVALVVGTMVTNSARSTKQVTLSNDSAAFINEINWFLSDPVRCTNSLTGKNAADTPATGGSAIQTLKDAANANIYQTTALVSNQSAGASQFKIISYALKEDSNALVANNKTNLRITIETKGSSSTDTMQSVRNLILFVNVNGSGNITNCRSLGGTQDIWTRGTANPTDIYYSMGNVGVGTASPISPLTVSGTNNQITLLDSNSTNTSTTGGTVISSNDGILSFRGTDSSGNLSSAPLVLDQVNGRVGIGTTNPGNGYASGTASLHLAQANYGPTMIIQSTATPVAGSGPSIQFLGNGSDPVGQIGARWKTTGSNTDSSLVFQTRVAGVMQDRMVIGENGFVGLGTSNPGTQFNVVTNADGPAGWVTLQNTFVGNASNTMLNFQAPSGVAQMRIGTNSSTYNDTSLAYFGPSQSFIMAPAGTLNFATGTMGSGSVIRFFTGGNAATNERMRIDPYGSVGVGTQAPTEKLHVVGNILASGLKMGSGNNLSWGTSGSVSISGNTTSNYLALSTSSSERVRIDSSGNMGIGTTTPQSKLDVNGSIKISNDLSCAASKEGSIRYDPITKVTSICNGTSWVSMVVPSVMCSNMGGTWDGTKCSIPAAAAPCDCASAPNPTGGAYCNPTTHKVPSGRTGYDAGSGCYYVCVTGSWSKLNCGGGGDPAL